MSKMKIYIVGDHGPEHNSMWKEMIRNLSCNDPEKIDNGAWETPYIQEHEVKK